MEEEEAVAVVVVQAAVGVQAAVAVVVGRLRVGHICALGLFRRCM